MKQQILFSILFVGLIFGSHVAEANDVLKTAYVDATHVFESSKVGKGSKAVLEDYVKARQKIVDQDEQELKKMEEDLNKQDSILSTDARREKGALFQQKVAQFQKRAGDLSREIQDKKSEVLHEFNKKLEAVVKKIAEKEGFQLVLDKNPVTGTVVYISPSMDISNKVIEMIDRENR